jgi:outer membrane protein TolC
VVPLAEQRLRAAESRAAAGKTSRLEALDAAIEVLQARLDAGRAALMRIVSQAEIEKTAGQL